MLEDEGFLLAAIRSTFAKRSEDPGCDFVNFNSPNEVRFI